MANEKVKYVMDLINGGKDYSFDDGKLYRNGKEVRGSLGSEDGNLWFNVKSKAVQARTLAYAMYHGLDALEGKIIKLIDDTDPRNLTKENLIALPKKGYAPLLKQARTGLHCNLTFKLEQPIETYEVPKQAQTVAQQEIKTNVITQPLAGKALLKAVQETLRTTELSLKEIAEMYGVTYKKVWGIKRKMVQA